MTKKFESSQPGHARRLPPMPSAYRRLKHVIYTRSLVADYSLYYESGAGPCHSRDGWPRWVPRQRVVDRNGRDAAAAEVRGFQGDNAVFP